MILSPAGGKAYSGAPSCVRKCRVHCPNYTVWYTHDRFGWRVDRPLVTTVPLKKRILCIEDDPEMINLMRLILERRGFLVEGAEGGLAGLQAVSARPPDLVLLDLMMPDMDGWDVHQRIRADANTRGIPVIIVTASAQNIDREFALHIARVDDYIVKPFSPQELLASVDRLLNPPVG